MTALAFTKAFVLPMEVDARRLKVAIAGDLLPLKSAEANFQSKSAERAVRNLPGVISIWNTITIKPQTSAAQVKEKVEAALQRQAKADSKSIRVDLSGGLVTLTGYASSWQAIEDAANAAWAAPGVTQVIDQVKMQMTP